MKLSTLSAVLLAGSVAAHRIDFKQSRRPTSTHHSRRGLATLSKANKPKLAGKFNTLAAVSGGTKSGLALSDVRDLLYLANITVGGNDYPVQLDTGSSDLWIKGPNGTLPNVTHTSTTYNLTYGIGWAYGPISHADVQFAGLDIPNQALMDISSAYNPALSYGADGILGLGFTSLSTIDALVNKTGSDAGRSLLYNAFAQNKSEPNFVAFALERSGDSDPDAISGSFAIGEYEPQWAKVADTSAIPTWPVVSPTRWNILLEALIVNQTITPVTTNVTGAPSNRAVALIDSGTSYSYASEDFCHAIYGGIPGAKYDPAQQQWVVPCNAEIDMALQFGGRAFPIHPLDVTPQNPSNANQCLGTFIPQSVSVGAGQFDILFGDNVLRSMYTIFDFGDYDSSGAMGNPFVKLLSVIDADEASQDFASARATVARKNIKYPTANTAANNSTGNSADAAGAVSSESAQMLNTLAKYFPALAAIIALNTLIVLALLLLAMYWICTQRRKEAKKRGNARPRSNIGRQTPRALTPMPMDDFNYAPPAPVHTYEPVSMALSEADTVLALPSPGFKYDPDSAKGMNRPHSYAPSTSGSPAPIRIAHLADGQGTVPEDQPFQPPSPGFTRTYSGNPGERPRSYA